MPRLKLSYFMINTGKKQRRSQASIVPTLPTAKPFPLPNDGHPRMHEDCEEGMKALASRGRSDRSLRNHHPLMIICFSQFQRVRLIEECNCETWYPINVPNSLWGNSSQTPGSSAWCWRLWREPFKVSAGVWQYTWKNDWTSAGFNQLLRRVSGSLRLWRPVSSITTNAHFAQDTLHNPWMSPLCLFCVGAILTIDWSYPFSNWRFDESIPIYALSWSPTPVPRLVYWIRYNFGSKSVRRLATIRSFFYPKCRSSRILLIDFISAHKIETRIVIKNYLPCSAWCLLW